MQRCTGWKPVPLRSILPNLHCHYSVQDLSSFYYPHPLGLSQGHLAGFYPENPRMSRFVPEISRKSSIKSHFDPALSRQIPDNPGLPLITLLDIAEAKSMLPIV
jgi:hypothetical protein